MRSLPLDIGMIHFVGIGGIGMSGIAEVMHVMGYEVQGSDLGENANTRRLSDMGVPVMIGHREENIAGAGVVTVSSAVTQDNVEMQAARARHIPVVRRAEMLAEAARTFAGYDLNRDGQLTENEYRGRPNVRGAMGGFVKEHSAEFDQDGNRIISREEVESFALRMFTKADADGNNIVTNQEANTRGGGKARGNQPRKR